MNKIDLNINFDEIKSHDDYKKIWENLSPVEVTMIEINETCRHKPGDRFVFENPYMKPDNICQALLHVLELYLWRCSLGFPSWNENDRNVFQIHCPDKKGTVWEMKKIR